MYFYVAYRRQLGGSELRANRLISFYLFFILLGLVLSVAVYTATEQFHFPDVGILIALGASAVSVITGVFTFSHFQRFVERRLLGIPVSRADLIESYAAQITASLNRPALVSLSTNEVLPSLLIRQSALLFFDGRGVSAVYAQAVVSGQLPALGDIPGFQEYRILCVDK